MIHEPTTSPTQITKITGKPSMQSSLLDTSVGSRRHRCRRRNTPPPLLPGSHRHHRHRRIPQLKATGGLRRILRVGRMPRLPFAVRGGHHHSLWGSALLPLTREKRSEWSGWGCPLRPSLSLSTCEWKCSRLALLGFYSASFFRENLISIIYYIL